MKFKETQYFYAYFLTQYDFLFFNAPAVEVKFIADWVGGLQNPPNELWSDAPRDTERK